MNHKTGPWKITVQPKGWIFIGTDERQKLATVLVDCEEDKANARLIATAPELLEALDIVLHYLERDFDMSGNDDRITGALQLAYVKADEAIKKARGT